MNVKDLPYKYKKDFYSAYQSRQGNVLECFDYDPYDRNSYISRWRELQERPFPRTALYEHLITYHQGFPASDQTLQNIEKIKDPTSTVVVTGQQAGLLTGPLFTINKCLSAVAFARKQEKALGTPVVPVFWIAGEDHDFEEINHVHIPEKGRVVKKRFVLAEGHRSVSHIPLPDSGILHWAEEIIRSHGETEHTQGVKELVREAVTHTTTVTEFFGYLILVLFKDQGIVVLDSNHPELRDIETPFFEEIIQKNEELDTAFKDDVRAVRSLGFPSPVDSEENNAHLFVQLKQDRVLLLRKGEQYRGKKNECLFSKDQLIELAKTKTHLLSNNVITRPLMQEKLLPTLAYIGGPGEIAYWSLLKSIFRTFSVKVPPVVPRLSVTVFDPYTLKIINEKNLNVDSVFVNGVSAEKEKWLQVNTDPEINKVFDRALSTIKESHQSLTSIANEWDKGLQPLAEKNWTIIEDQVEFLKQSIHRSIYKKYESELKKFDHIQLQLFPDEQPQERVFNIFYYLNQYGMDFITDLASQNYTWNGAPKAVIL